MASIEERLEAKRRCISEKRAEVEHERRRIEKPWRDSMDLAWEEIKKLEAHLPNGIVRFRRRIGLLIAAKPEAVPRSFL